MKRHVAYGAILFCAIAIWIALKFSLSGASPSLLTWFVDVSPWYCLMTFGSYCLGRLGMDLLTFNDYPEEIKKLEKVLFTTKSLLGDLTHFSVLLKDIIEAKKDLKARGFST